ncbi:hypothetical protein AB5J56_08125 [Streptomyces sp. R21]|uniref:Integral membrane protein n=1 Tax=Streptomyces sp. R21 TaxID=3238627 RepID=A0AB39P2C1_9ACTN
MVDDDGGDPVRDAVQQLRLHEPDVIRTCRTYDQDGGARGGVLGVILVLAGLVYTGVASLTSMLLFGSLVVRGPQFGWTLLLGAFDLLLGILVLVSWPSSSKYVIGAFIALALLFDGLGLIATGYGGRRIVGLVSDRLAADVTERDESVERGGKPVQPE